jgi:hypothetical protein
MKYVKMFETFVDNSTPCAIYNAEEKKLIGLFKSRTLAAKYIGGNVSKGMISSSIANNDGIRASSNPFNVRLAARNINPAQRELLGDKVYLIFNNYPEPSHYNFGYNDVLTDRDIILQKQRDAENKSNIQSLIDYNKGRKKEKENYKEMDDLIKSAYPAPQKKASQKKHPK